MLDPNRYELNAATVGFRKRMRQEVSMEAFEMALQQQTDTIKVRREEKETPISEVHVMGAQRFGLGGNEKTKTAERQWRQIHGYPLRSFKADGGPIVLPVKRVDSALATPINVGLTQYLKYNATVGEYVSRITEPVLDHITSENPMIRQARVTGMEQTYAETMDNLRQWNEKRSNQYQNAMARAMAQKSERPVSATARKAGVDMATSARKGSSSSKKARAEALEAEQGRQPVQVADPEVYQPYGSPIGKASLPANATPAQIGSAIADQSADRSYTFSTLMKEVQQAYDYSNQYDERYYQPAADLNEKETIDFQASRSSMSSVSDRRNRTPNPRSVSGSSFDEMLSPAFTPAMRNSQLLANSANLSGSSVRPGMPGPPVALVENAVQGAVATGSNGGSLSVTDQIRQNKAPGPSPLESLRSRQASFVQQLEDDGNVAPSNLMPVPPASARDSGSAYTRLLSKAAGALGFPPAAPVEPAMQTPLAGNATRSFASGEGNTDMASPASGSSLLQASQGFRSRSGSSSRPQGRQSRVAIEGPQAEVIDFRSPIRQRPSAANVLTPRGNRVANQMSIIN